MVDNKVYNIYSKEDLQHLEGDLNYGDVLIWKKYQENEIWISGFYFGVILCVFILLMVSLFFWMWIKY